jgi:hypothetical protein
MPQCDGECVLVSMLIQTARNVQTDAGVTVNKRARAMCSQCNEEFP